MSVTLDASHVRLCGTAVDHPGDAVHEDRDARRQARAIEEPMVVAPVLNAADDRVVNYLVATTSDRPPYVVDADLGTCRCPDHEHREARCKHLRRVALAADHGDLTPHGAVADREAARDRLVAQRDAIADHLVYLLDAREHFQAIDTDRADAALAEVEDRILEFRQLLSSANRLLAPLGESPAEPYGHLPDPL